MLNYTRLTLLKYARKKQQLSVVEVNVLAKKIAGEVRLLRVLLTYPSRFTHIDDAIQVVEEIKNIEDKINNGSLELSVKWLSDFSKGVINSTADINFFLIEIRDRLKIDDSDLIDPQIDKILYLIDKPTSGGRQCILDIIEKGRDILNYPNGESALKIVEDISESIEHMKTLCKVVKSKYLSLIFGRKTIWLTITAFLFAVPIFYIYRVFFDIGASSPEEIFAHTASEWSAFQSNISESSSALEAIKLLSGAIWSLVNGVPIACLIVAITIRAIRSRINPGLALNKELEKYESALYGFGERTTSNQSPKITLNLRLGDRFSNITGCKIVNRANFVDI